VERRVVAEKVNLARIDARIWKQIGEKTSFLEYNESKMQDKQVSLESEG